MKTTKNTVLITGGSAGIGFEIARRMADRDNQVIILGRNAERLEKAALQIKNVIPLVFDVSKEEDITRLAERISREFPQLNMLINNAGRAFAYRLGEGALARDKASDEMQTNYLGLISLTEKLLGVLSRQPEAAVINVTSVVAFLPSAVAPTYAASKAAVHSYTQSLRHALAQTGIQVFELMPPLVNTSFSKEIGGIRGMDPGEVARQFIEGLEKDIAEIHVGKTADLYRLFLSSPEEAFGQLNAERATAIQKEINVQRHKEICGLGKNIFRAVRIGIGMEGSSFCACYPQGKNFLKIITLN